jgi:hypothetical protein
VGGVADETHPPLVPPVDGGQVVDGPAVDGTLRGPDDVGDVLLVAAVPACQLFTPVRRGDGVEFLPVRLGRGGVVLSDFFIEN